MEINKQQYLKLLVVGGSGFIGQHVVKKALQKGFETTVLSKNDCNANDRLEGVVYLSADISNKEVLITQLKGRLFDYVVNLGGYVNHKNYFDDGKKIYDVHFSGVKNLVDCLEKSEIKGFIQIGSSDEYGENLAPQNENQREAPFSIYSCAKVHSTHFLQTLYKTENFPAVILRPFLVYGPGQSIDRFIPQVINGCLTNEKFSSSKGEQLRDFCFIDDFVEAIFNALGNSNIYGEVINISSGKPVSIKTVVRMIVDIIGFGRPQFGKVLYRDGENKKLYADIDKAEKLLGWKPTVGLEKGLSKTIEWVKNN